MSLCRVMAIWVVIAFGSALPACAAEPDWSGCAVPSFGADKQKAIDACQKVLAQAGLSDAERKRALIIQGRAAYMAHDLATATLDFDEAITLDPKDPETLVRRASVAFGKNDYASAVEFAERALRLDANYAPAFDILGTIGLATGNYRLAKASYDKETELTPNDVMARFHHFEYFMDTGAQAEALSEVEKLLALDPSELDTKFTIFRGRDISFHTLARLERATMLQAMWRLPDALAAFDDFVRVDPGPFSYGWRGLYHLQQAEPELAKVDIDRALDYAPDYWILHYFRGNFYLLTEDYESARQSFTRSLELGPDCVCSPYWSRALALRGLHRIDEAQADALRAMTEDNDFRRRKLQTLARLGYFQPVSGSNDVMPAVREAAMACMLDERCR